jgi:hypothetical protein
MMEALPPLETITGDRKLRRIFNTPLFQVRAQAKTEVKNKMPLADGVHWIVVVGTGPNWTPYGPIISCPGEQLLANFQELFLIKGVCLLSSH